MSEHTHIYQKLQSSATISEESMRMLMGIALLKQVPKGQHLLHEGKICNSIFFVEKGCIRSYITKEGKEINIDFALEKDFITNLRSLRSASPSECNFEAYEDTTVYEFKKEALFALYKQSAEIESYGRKLLEELLMLQEEQTQHFKIYSPAERYEHLCKHRPELLQRVSLTQLSSYLGIARETLSRIRKHR